MTPPPIQLFLTTIASQITLRQRQEYILRILQVKKIPFTSYDLASDEDAKRLWKRKAPLDKQQLPGILVGGKFPGTFSEFEEAVEFNELEIFLRQNEEWKAPEDERSGLVAKPIGVPGAYEPLQMFPKHAPSRSPSPNPLSLREKEKKELDVSNDLGEFGLEGVSVSADDLRALVAELGLGGDEANDLVNGLSGDVPVKKSEKAKQEPVVPKPDEKAKDKKAKDEKAHDVKPEDIKPASEIKPVSEIKPTTEAKPVPEIKVELETKVESEIKVEPEFKVKLEDTADETAQDAKEEEPQAAAVSENEEKST